MRATSWDSISLVVGHLLFLDREGNFTRIAVRGAVGAAATGINDVVGQIVGFYGDNLERYHGFLATPTP